MRLLFISFSPVRFDVATPTREPLGGMESAAAYLMRALALRHGVTLAAHLPNGTPEMLDGVRHVPLVAAEDPAFFAAADFDAVIALSAPANAGLLRQMAPGAFHVAWLHMLPDQPAMAGLGAMAPMIDCAVFVSHTHRTLVPYDGASQVIGNAIAPAFENLFGTEAELRAAKRNRAVYTSMPGRGLALLVEAMALAKIETRLDVYSAMRTYQMGEEPMAGLYARLEQTPRCRHHGAIGQAALAQELKSAALLAYPSIFTETFCIAAAEAMAAGIKVVATDLGALRETTLGFADLVPLGPDLVTRYAAQLEQVERAFMTQPQEWAAERFAQIQAINRQYTWAARAREWETFLGPAIAWKRGA
jgi:glycosyltransferase involved in cell wall biosynthesis